MRTGQTVVSDHITLLITKEGSGLRDKGLIDHTECIMGW